MACYIFTYFPYRYDPPQPRGRAARVNQQLRRRHRLAKGLVDRVHLTPAFQKQLIDMAVQWAPKRRLRLHYMHTRLDYLQIVVSWRFYEHIDTVQRWFVQDISYQLNTQRYYPQQWFSRHINRKQIADRVTYDYLVGEYMPSRAMYKWVDPRPLPPTDQVHPRNVRCMEQLHKKQILERAGVITPHGKLLRHIHCPYRSLNEVYKAMDEGTFEISQVTAQ